MNVASRIAILIAFYAISTFLTLFTLLKAYQGGLLIEGVALVIIVMSLIILPDIIITIHNSASKQTRQNITSLLYAINSVSALPASANITEIVHVAKVLHNAYTPVAMTQVHLKSLCLEISWTLVCYGLIVVASITILRFRCLSAGGYKSKRRQVGGGGDEGEGEVEVKVDDGKVKGELELEVGGVEVEVEGEFDVNSKSKEDNKRDGDVKKRDDDVKKHNGDDDKDDDKEGKEKEGKKIADAILKLLYSVQAEERAEDTSLRTGIKYTPDKNNLQGVHARYIASPSAQQPRTAVSIPVPTVPPAIKPAVKPAFTSAIKPTAPPAQPLVRIKPRATSKPLPVQPARRVVEEPVPHPGHPAYKHYTYPGCTEIHPSYWAYGHSDWYTPPCRQMCQPVCVPRCRTRRRCRRHCAQRGGGDAHAEEVLVGGDASMPMQLAGHMGFIPIITACHAVIRGLSASANNKKTPELFATASGAYSDCITRRLESVTKDVDVRMARMILQQSATDIQNKIHPDIPLHLGIYCVVMIPFLSLFVLSADLAAR